MIPILNVMKKLFLTVFALLMPISISAPVWADEPPIYTSWRDNLGAGGYDIVSFYSGAPRKGKAEFATQYMGANWQFQTQANLDLFGTNPEAFLPQYGGYCAWAVAKGKLAKGSPDYWHVEDGKLYLNYNKRIKKRWDKRRESLIDKADQRWPGILTD